jgi:hypothetical protein
MTRIFPFLLCFFLFHSVYASSSTIANDRSLGSRSSSSKYAELADLWLCLACALGWTVWLVSSRKQSEPEPIIYDLEESIQVTGNVLEVKLGEDADGTGIPVYLALIDYVVEYYDPDIDTIKFLPPKASDINTNFSEGVVLQQDSDAPKDKHVQIRKCFYTNRLLEEGFANIKILCLVSDPTTSMLYADYKQEQRQHKQPPDAMVLYLVYAIAIILIVTSLYGGYRTIPKLVEEQQDLAYLILIVGTIVLYPLAMLLYYSFSLGYRQVSERKGTIIHGSGKFQCTSMACGVHPIMEEDDEQEAASLRANSSIAQRRYNGNIEDLQGLEMPSLADISTSEYLPPPPSRQYPNAGCGLNDYNVQTLKQNSSTVSSISSNGTVKSSGSGTQITSCLSTEATSVLAFLQDSVVDVPSSTSQLMEAFQNMSAMAAAPTLENTEEPSEQVLHKVEKATISKQQEDYAQKTYSA